VLWLQNQQILVYENALTRSTPIAVGRVRLGSYAPLRYILRIQINAAVSQKQPFETARLSQSIKGVH